MSNGDTLMVQLGIIGGPRAGKSTFIGALQTAGMLDPAGQWKILGNEEIDQGSTQRLLDATFRLRNKEFPAPTTVLQPITYTIDVHGSINMAHTYMQNEGVMSSIRSLLRGDQRQTDVHVRLKIVDHAGGDLGLAALRHDAQVYAHLSGCQGIIYLYDPQFDENLEYLLVPVNVLPQLMGNQLIDHQMPHFVAACVSKLDAPETLQRLGFPSTSGPGLISDVYDSNRGPYPADPKLAFEHIVDLETQNVLRANFLESRTQYFFVSGIGYYRESVKSPVDPATCMTQVLVPPHEGGAPRIKGAIVPINIIEPIAWLYWAIARSMRGNP